ncbi:MAG: zf-HC2 domain-containing protein [Planctomycetota bacterium]
MKTDHHWLQERLGAYRDGELTPGEHALVQRHVESCEACRSAMEALEAVDSWMALTVGASEERVARDSMETAMANAESELTLTRLDRFFLRHRYLAPALGAAAVLVTLLAIWLTEIRQTSRAPHPDLELLSSWDALQLPSIVESDDALDAASLLVEELDR